MTEEIQDTQQKSFMDDKYDPEGKPVIDDTVIAVSYMFPLLRRVLIY